MAEDKTKAVEWYARAAEQEHPRAMCNLGLCYEYGEGVAEDKTKAAEWYEKAARRGYAPAQCEPGLLL